MFEQKNPTDIPKGAQRLSRRDAAIHLVGLELGLVAVLGASLAAAAPAPEPHVRIARLTEGQVTGQAFARLTASMDPAMLNLAVRFEPRLMMASAPAAEIQLVSTSVDAGAAEEPVIPLQALSPNAARVWNELNPVAAVKASPARPFKLDASGVLDEARALDCMTAAIYYEAANESTDGQRAVAQVVLNRMRHPAFPKTVCGVVFQGSNRRTGCQFSFTCDGSLGRRPSEGGWARSRQVAAAALDGYVMAKVGTATHYHANYVAPYWSPSLVKLGSIGAHIFYRWTGRSGLPPAFSGSYAGGEMSGLQIATLDGLNKSGPRSDVVNTANTGSAAVSENVVEPLIAIARHGEDGSDGKAGADILTAASAGIDAVEIAKPEELDWAGRPKSRGPARLAMPSS